MDDLKFNKIAAGFLLAALLAMAGYKISEMLVPHQELAENAYPIEVQLASTSTDAPVAEQGLSLFWHCWRRQMWMPVSRWRKNVPLATYLKRAARTR